MITVQQASIIGAALARIESVLIRANGVLGCLQIEHAIPEHWQSQVKENRDLLQKATLDVVTLEKEILR